MKILLVAATRIEIEPLLSRYASSAATDQLIIGEYFVDVLVTGVGMVATAFALGHQLATKQYDLAINAGIAGSFDFSLPLGEVVQITEDVFAEQGAEDGEGFLSLNDLGFGEITQHAVPGKRTLKDLESITKVKAITVNRVHGNEFTIAKTLSRFNARVESMEGAAFFYACNQTATPSLQIRSISNHVEPRNKENWNIGLAVKNLNDFLSNMLTA